MFSKETNMYYKEDSILLDISKKIDLIDLIVTSYV